MTGGAVRGVLVLVAALAAWTLACTAAVARTADHAAALEALTERDVFVSSRELGPDVAPTVEARLQAKVDELAGRGHAVKMAIVSPLRGDGAFGYAARLRRELGFDGTLLVTTLNGPVGAAGPRDGPQIQAKFAAARVNANGSASERLIIASDLAVPSPQPRRRPWRGLVAFVAMALLGAATAVTWGLRREQGRNRRIADHERAALVVGLDALRARLDVLEARTPEPPADVSEALAEARRHHSEGRAAAQQAGPTFDAVAGFQALYDGMRSASVAAASLGEPFAVERPLDGLCSADPGHGPATELATLAGGSNRVPVCAACQAAAKAGTPPRRRLLPGLDGPVPFDQVDLSPVGVAEHRVDDDPVATPSA